VYWCGQCNNVTSHSCTAVIHVKYMKSTFPSI